MGCGGRGQAETAGGQGYAVSFAALRFSPRYLACNDLKTIGRMKALFVDGIPGYAIRPPARC